MSTQNKKLARQVFDIQTNGNVALIDQIVARDYVGHTQPKDIHGPEGARKFVAMLRGAFPDMQVTIEDQIEEGDQVATRWTCRGTHQGPFLNMPPTGKHVEMAGLTVFRIANGKLVEGWNHPDLLSLLQQIDAMPAPSN